MSNSDSSETLIHLLIGHPLLHGVQIRDHASQPLDTFHLFRRDTADVPVIGVHPMPEFSAIATDLGREAAVAPNQHQGQLPGFGGRVDPACQRGTVFSDHLSGILLGEPQFFRGVDEGL